MIPAQFEYERVDSVEAAIAALQADDGAKLLAGGHSLLPQMKLRFAMPTKLIDIGRLGDLSYVREDSDEVAIGALTRYHDLEASDALRQGCPIVARSPARSAIRRSGTWGRSVGRWRTPTRPATCLRCCSPSARRSSRRARAAPGRSRRPTCSRACSNPALANDEVLTEIRVPKTAGGWSYQKFTRRAQDWAVVGVAAVRMNGSANVSLTNMGLTPLRAAGVEEALAGGADPATAAERADEGSAPPSDSFGSDEYRRALSKVLVRRALEEALA